MLPVELLQVSQLTIHAADTGKVGIQNQKTTLIDVLVQMHTKSREVRFTESSLLAIQLFKQRLHMSGLLGSRNEGIKMLVKSHQPRFILFPHRHIRKHQRSINRIIEQSHSPKSLLHHPAFIYHTVNLLRAFVLIDIYHQFMPAGTRFPVDSPVVISLYIFLDLLKFRLMAYPADTLDTQFGKVITHCQQFVSVKHQIGRIYLDILRLPTSVPTGNQPDFVGYKYTDLPERIYSATGRTKMVTDCFPLVWLKGGPETDIPILEDKRYFIYDLQRERTRISTFDTNAHFIVIAIGETVGTSTECLNPLGTVENISVCRYQHE